MINGQIAQFLQQVQPQPGIVPNYQLPAAPALLPPSASALPAAPGQGGGGSNSIMQMIQKLLGGGGGQAGITASSGANLDPTMLLG